MGALLEVGRSNLISQARSTLHVFGAMMRHEWWGQPIVQEAFRQALAHGVKLHLVLGPFFDMGSFSFIRMLRQYNKLVTLYLIGTGHQRLVYDEQTGLWIISVSIVSDRRHAFLAETKESRTALNRGGTEYMNAEEVAAPLMATFDRLADSAVVTRARPAEFIAASRATGLRLERWTESGLSGLESKGQWVGLTDDEVAAYERELAQAAA